MTGDPLPDADHVVRYCSPRQVENGVPRWLAFRPRPGDEYPSVNWAEFLGAGDLSVAVGEMRGVFGGTFRLRTSGRFVVLNVGDVGAAVTRPAHPFTQSTVRPSRIRPTPASSVTPPRTPRLRKQSRRSSCLTTCTRQSFDSPGAEAHTSLYNSRESENRRCLTQPSSPKTRLQPSPLQQHTVRSSTLCMQVVARKSPSASVSSVPLMSRIRPTSCPWVWSLYAGSRTFWSVRTSCPDRGSV